MVGETEPSAAPSTDAQAGAEASATRSARGSSQSKVIAADKFEIDYTRPAQEFSHPFAEAFECSGDGKSNDCVALIIRGRYPVRHDVIKAILQTDIPSLMILRTTAVVNWTPDGTQRLALIYRRPSGSPLVNNITQRRELVTEDILRRNIIRPLSFALRAFAEHGLFHGNIRPDNIFLAATESAEAVLGECVSSIPGINQPALFETIERGMADPSGKGLGTSQDDIYAFGVTIALLLRGDDPMAGKSDKFIVEEKVNRSTFSVMTDGIRLSPGLSEFLRATLNDDIKQRWTTDQVMAWVDGARTTPKSTAVSQRAQRSLDFNNKKYYRVRLLARDLPDNVPEAVSLIESGMLAKWLERGLGDQERLDIVNDAVARVNIGGKSQGYEDRLVCNVSMALDPKGPVRFKGLNVYPAGIGYSLSHAILTGQPLQPYAELIRDRWAWLWFSYKENGMNERVDLSRHFDMISKLIIRRGINFGLERCLYELSPYTPCLSELLKDHYVLDGLDLINALDDIAPRSKGSKPIDRHIAAFVSIRDAHDNSGIMSAIDSGDKTKYSLALLNLYQGLQKRSDKQSHIELCEWLRPEMEVVTQRLFNVKLKQEVEKALNKEMKTGSLRRILALIDNASQVRRDQDEFQKASMLYRAMGVEKDRIRNQLENNPNYGQGSGQHTAMIISAVVSGIVMAALVMKFIMEYFGGKL